MKILVLRFSSIGDIVLTTPVFRCLKLQTGATIHYLTRKSFAAVLEANPYIDRLWTFDKNPLELLSQLQAEKFDRIIDLHHNLRSLRVKNALGAPAVSFNKLNFEKWLLVNLGIDRLPDVHIVQRYLKTVASLGVQYDGKGLDYFIPAGQEIDVSTIDPSLRPDQYIAFVLGATHATKRLPLPKMLEICKRIDQSIVLLGGKAEMETASLLMKSLPAQSIFNACGQLSLHQSASVVGQAAKVLTHDTGLMHIAAAFGKKIVSVWGNTVPKFGMYPFYPDGISNNVTVEVQGLRCRPCSKIGYQKCPKGHFRCMNEQDAGQIASVLNS